MERPVSQLKSLKSGVSQIAVALVVVGGVLLLGAVASSASAGRTGQSQQYCYDKQTETRIPCPTITLDTVTTTEAPTTTEMETSTTEGEMPTTTMVETSTTMKPQVQAQARVLARTGTNTTPLVALAFGLLAAGGAVLMTAARKRTV